MSKPDDPLVSSPKAKRTFDAPKIFALLLTIIYLAVAFILLAKFGFGDGAGGNWERALTIFNAFSAIGFAAVGVLLGTTVQQVNVDKAQDAAAKAKAGEAEAKQKEAAAKKSETTLAQHSESLSKAVSDLLSRQSFDGQAFRAESFDVSALERAHEARMVMDAALAQRSRD